MKLMLLCLGSFVLGVFVGARMWAALLFCAVIVAAWCFGVPRPPPDLPAKPSGPDSPNRGR